MTSRWEQLRRHPIESLGNAWRKLVVDRLRYRQKDGYDASRYWSDRFSRFGTSIRGAGHEGMGATENAEEYARAADVFRKIVADVGIDFSVGRTLEIGTGTGFYTKLMVSLGADLVGYDITNVLFDELQSELPDVEFRQADITETPVEGRFDRAVMIDVLEHIVDEKKFARALRNVADSLLPGGRFIVGPLREHDAARRYLYYVRFWSIRQLNRTLADMEIEASAAFRDGRLLVLRRVHDAGATPTGVESRREQ